MSSSKLKVENKVAIITSGASGIREETARTFILNGAGAVVITDIQEEQGKKVAESIGQVSDEEQVKKLIDSTIKLYGMASPFKEQIMDFSLPASLKQPGSRDGTIKCYIKRDKSKSTYHLFLSIGSGPGYSLLENGKFLLSAKRNRRTTSIEYVISTDADNISKSSSTFIGKLRSNFLGTKFIIYDNQPSYNDAADQVAAPALTSRRFFYSRKVSPKIPTANYNIAQLKYALAFRQPRRMHCVMHSIPASAIESELSDIGDTDTKDKPLILRNKPPRWHEQLRCWCLNFRGRVTVASVKNFQFLAATDGPPTTAQTSAGSDYDKIILQFGKVGKDIFTMDYRYPLSAFQAFAICLSSFDSKLA